MRTLLLFLTAIICYPVLAQVSNVEMRGDFAEASRLGRLQGGESLPQYSSGNIKGSRYLTETWAQGSVVPVTGNTVDGLLVMFDKQEHDIYIKKADANKILLLDKGQVKSFYINNRFFISGATLAGGETGLYYEKLAGRENKIALYKITTTKFVKADKTDLERVKKGDFDDEFKDAVTYYIKSGNQPLQRIRLKEKDLIKALPEEEKKIKAYLNIRGSGDNEETTYTDLVNFLNQ
jgi:hypothetical protein